MKIGYYLKNPKRIMLKLLNTKLGQLLSDESYLSLKYALVFGEKIDLVNPKTFNEKLQWLKLHDRKSIYTTMVDKYEVKEYVKKLIGKEYIIPTLGIWDTFDQINFEELPEKFVLKCTHDSGGIYICTNKNRLDKKKAKSILNRSLVHNYYYAGREWPYKNVKPRIIAEQYMEDESGYELKDYKFFCFSGEPKLMFIASDRNTPGEEPKFDFYDMDFKHMPIINGHPNSKKAKRRPESFLKMKELAAILSEGIPQVRIDFYEINGAIYFGEITLFHWSGFMPFEPKEWDRELGDMVILPKQK